MLWVVFIKILNLYYLVSLEWKISSLFSEVLFVCTLDPILGCMCGFSDTFQQLNSWLCWLYFHLNSCVFGLVVHLKNWLFLVSICCWSFQFNSDVWSIVLFIVSSVISYVLVILKYAVWLHCFDHFCWHYGSRRG